MYVCFGTYQNKIQLNTRMVSLPNAYASTSKREITQKKVHVVCNLTVFPIHRKSKMLMIEWPLVE